MSMSEKNETTAKPKKVKAPKPAKVNKGDLPNPVWYGPVMVGFLLLGLLWILVYYISAYALPLGTMWATTFPALNLQNWNLVIGFGLLLVGFGMTTRWK
jgi:hypothetical protein